METVLLSIENNIAFITLNRPDKFNSFNREMAMLMQKHLDTCQADASVRCVYITGAGKAFSAGQDLSELTGEKAIGIDRILTEHYNPIITRIRKVKKPVVAVVNGVAAGAGANIALCCDVVLATQSASFIQAFSKIGLIPDSGGTYFLPRLIGFQKASAVMMLADKVSAVEAERLGMIYRYFPDEEFAAESLKIATTLSQMPTRGLALTKAALNHSLSNSLEEQLSLEDVLQQEAAGSADYREGVNAFLEKRVAVFKGA